MKKKGKDNATDGAIVCAVCAWPGLLPDHAFVVGWFGWDKDKVLAEIEARTGKEETTERVCSLCASSLRGIKGLIVSPSPEQFRRFHNAEGPSLRQQTKAKKVLASRQAGDRPPLETTSEKVADENLAATHRAIQTIRTSLAPAGSPTGTIGGGYGGKPGNPYRGPRPGRKARAKAEKNKHGGKKGRR